MSAPAPDSPGQPASDETAAAVAELRILVHRLADEVAAFRRRAIAAEGRLRELEARVGEQPTAPPATEGAEVPAPSAEDLARLERENADLRERLALAADRTRQLLDRARFLRQQGEAGA